MVETEIFCHGCDTFFRVNFDGTKNGNHVVKCPTCKHEHCRVIVDGRITSTRWDRQNGPSMHYSASTSSYSATIFKTYGSSTTKADDNYPGAWTEWRSV